MATSFTTHSAGQTITSADVNLIQTAVNTLENTTNPALGSFPPSALGFIAWNMDPATSATSALTTVTTTVYAHAFYLPASTVTNFHVINTNSNTPTTALMAIYSTAGTLLGTSANQAGVFGSSGMKTIPLTAPLAVAAGTYYVVFWQSGGTAPALLRANINSTSALLNVATNGLFRGATSGTSATTAAPSPLGTLTGVGNAVWIGAS